MAKQPSISISVEPFVFHTESRLLPLHAQRTYAMDAAANPFATTQSLTPLLSQLQAPFILHSPLMVANLSLSSTSRRFSTLNNLDMAERR